MKRIIRVCLILLVCVTLCSCQRSVSGTDGGEETAFVGEFNYVYGVITDKPAENLLTLKMDIPRMVETWGEYVYIETDEAGEWCVEDEIDVVISHAKFPDEASGYYTLVAESVSPLMLVKKPIIYLYPETPTECSVKLTLDGELTCTYPFYGRDGWESFTAYPDGTLVFPDGKDYYALYWEGTQRGNWDFSEGYCVKGEDTARFLEVVLSEMGLTRREANEFIVYWLPLMQDNPYNVISFQGESYTDSAVLDIAPAPDSVLRVFMAYYPSACEVDIEPQGFDGFARKGFTVVEWGGSEVRAPQTAG